MTRNLEQTNGRNHHNRDSALSHLLGATSSPSDSKRVRTRTVGIQKVTERFTLDGIFLGTIKLLITGDWLVTIN